MRSADLRSIDGWMWVDIPRVERRSDPAREDVAEILPLAPGPEPVLELLSPLLAQRREGKRGQVDRPARHLGLRRSDLVGPRIERMAHLQDARVGVDGSPPESERPQWRMGDRG
jgi:hypothetical protein